MFVILKQLLPVLDTTPEDMQYIDWCTCIEGDEKFQFETLQEAENKKIELQSDDRYIGRNLKIKEI
jgi:hypothetical protein